MCGLFLPHVDRLLVNSQVNGECPRTMSGVGRHSTGCVCGLVTRSSHRFINEPVPNAYVGLLDHLITARAIAETNLADL